MTIIRKRGIHTTPFPRKQEFLDEVYRVLTQARGMFPWFTLQDGDIPIIFYSKGQTSGRAIGQRVNGQAVFNIEFNVAAIEQEWDDMFNNTIPHEIAHIVDHLHKYKPFSHGYQWRWIARTLGCNGERCHSYKLPQARTRIDKQFEYQASCGTNIVLSTIRHNKVQRQEKVYIMKTTNGRVDASCFIREVA